MSGAGAKKKKNRKRREEMVDVVAQALPMQDPRARTEFAAALIRNLGATQHKVVPLKNGNPLEIGARYMQRAGPDSGPLFTAADVKLLRMTAVVRPDGPYFADLADRLELVVAKDELAGVSHG